MAGRIVQGLMGLLVSLGWVTWLSVVMLTSPDSLSNQILFFITFFVATLATFWALLYWASFRLFSSRRFQGNLRRALVQGVPPSLMLVVALWLQEIRAFNFGVGVILLVIVLVTEIVLLPKGSSQGGS